MRLRERLREVEIQAGDLLLLLGPEDTLDDIIVARCLPLAPGARCDSARETPPGDSDFAGAIVLASLELIYLPMALACVAVLYIVLDIVPLSRVYESIEWPVVVLLGAMIPISVALEASGGTELLADLFVRGTDGWPVMLILAALMLVTMTLSDVLNNVATALIAAPFLDVAERLQVSPDPFLMACSSRLLRVSDAHRPQEQHPHHGPGRLRLWRLLAHGPAARDRGGHRVPMILLVWPL